MRKVSLKIETEEHRQRALMLLSELSLDKPKVVTFADAKTMASTPQMRLYHMWVDKVVDIAGNHLGWDHDDMTAWFKKKFLPASGRIVSEHKGTVSIRLTTKTLTVQEMAAYTNAIDRFCASELDLILPHPSDSQRNW